MHKSLGNAVSPDDVTNQYGADILRLWVSSADYTQDMRISKEIMKQLSDAYLKIRNTARYILGNLNGFDPDKDGVKYEDMQELDKWALYRLNELVKNARASYDVYEFHGVYRAVYNFCVVDMSNFYLDIIKDRLYCDATHGEARRSAQTAIFTILDTMVRLIAPILAFTSEEIWAAMPHRASDDAESVLFNEIPEVSADLVLSEEDQEFWKKTIALRTDVNKALENARAEKTVGKSLDAEVTLYFNDEGWKSFEGRLENADLKTLFIVSKVTAVKGSGQGYEGVEFPGVTVKVEASAAPKCVRCWTHDEGVGSDHEHPDLCPRCAAAIKE
jgi:isoleucyl-tRNA synthetase